MQNESYHTELLVWWQNLQITPYGISIQLEEVTFVFEKEKALIS